MLIELMPSGRLDGHAGVDDEEEGQPVQNDMHLRAAKFFLEV